MYVCYLDDSYASDGVVMSLAGYAATEEQWASLEKEIDNLFRAFGVDALHAMEFHRRKGCFAGWNKAKRRAFVEGLGLMTRDLTLAMSVHVNRKNYRARQEELNLNAGMSAYCVGFSAIVHTVARGNSLWEQVDREGLRFVVEHGNPNNAEIAIHFEMLRTHGLYGDCLKAIEFSRKNGSRAIQLADFFAFYSRRWADRSLAAGANPRTERDEELRALEKYLPHSMHVVNETYAGQINDPRDTLYRPNRPAGTMPSESPVRAKPRRQGDKRG